MAVNMPVRDGPAGPRLIQFPDPHQRVCDIGLVEGCRPARLARKVTHVLLDGFGALADQVFQIEEAVSELAANAELYGRAPRRLRAYLDERSLWVGVFDGDFRTAGLVARILQGGNDPADLMSEHGRGLLLAYEACYGRCGVRSTPTEEGKEVLLRVALPRAGALTPSQQ